MSSKLQLTTLAVLVSAALPAHAALYKVVEVDSGLSGPEIKESTEYYGTAIQPSVAGVNCFESGTSSSTCEGYKLAGETRNRAAGFSYREEVPFAMDNSFGYIEDNYDGFEDYCFYQLGYSTCEYWASNQYFNGWSKELNNDKTPNSLAFVEGIAEKPADSINTVINSFTKASGASSTIGNYSNATSRNVPISGDTLTDSASKVWKQGRQWASNGTYTVGSVSSKTGIGTERYYYYSKPAVWLGSNLTAINWAGGKENDNDVFAQGSMRDLYVDNTTFYGVGYNNYNDQHMNATIFKADIDGSGTLTNIKSTLISNAQVDAGDDNTNSNSVATNINSNLIVVGQAKRSGNYPQNGAAANRLFVVADINSPSADFLNDLADAKSVFFNGAGGEMGGINNFNEIVGRVDAENNREYDGKQRRQRAFIYPYNGNGTIAVHRNIFKDKKDNVKAWLLDDLTNDGQASGNNNQYRIYDASDINDAGVISATALKCAGGYDSVASDSYCGNGNVDEAVVAVKLVPINLEKDSEGEFITNIQPRPLENSTIERQGGSLGFGALTLLGLFGFMRKRIK
ncbi:DUF3466 family protein [Aliivibrio finisterrensis]|uniref:DUF3466 family protein n=1 Tax=Aliivibrio finisterrensis TaxID=511998 RepID=UPI00101FA30A|nr:DUF3466 family protein [Aliivibrio finisterrensis]RYU68647.1 DUF3466 family protein [Aliivibrio finisterrensis]RYU72951.1 DUF3466 family protein [Aliivibrio finisterrensis]RYU75277.1 DUF3466 family protein [Aliivibrio finisterrensis]